MDFKNVLKNKKGITLLMAVLTVSVILSVVLTLLNIVVKQLKIVSSARESVTAIYAADTGIECALLWDIRGPEASFFNDIVFATSSESDNSVIPTGGGIECSGVSISNSWVVLAPTTQSATTTFQVNYSNPDACSIVDVSKYDIGGRTRTTVLSRGYNVLCNQINSNPNVVERAIRVRYIFN